MKIAYLRNCILFVIFAYAMQCNICIFDNRSEVDTALDMSIAHTNELIIMGN